MADVLTFVDLNAALTRCMAEHPPTGVELALHPDASRMANLWAEMLLTGQTSREWVSVDARVSSVFLNWAK